MASQRDCLPQEFVILQTSQINQLIQLTINNKQLTTNNYLPNPRKAHVSGKLQIDKGLH